LGWEPPLVGSATRCPSRPRAFHELAESEGDSFWEWFVIMGWPAPLGAIR
jgi:hypothetical protein